MNPNGVTPDRVAPNGVTLEKLLDVKVNFTNDHKLKNMDCFPYSIRALLIGSSNSGKSTLLFKLLLIKDMLDYNNLIILSTSLNQKEYQLIIHGFKNKLTKSDILAFIMNEDKFKTENGELLPINELCETFASATKPKGDISVTAVNRPEYIPHPDQLNSKKKNLCSFDDILEQRQNIISSYFTKGRHNACQSIYISQSYMHVPKGTIRNNCNFLILFKLDPTDVNNIHEQIVKGDMTLQEFRQLCNLVWNEKYKYLVIDKYNEDYNWKYTDGLFKPLSEFNKSLYDSISQHIAAPLPYGSSFHI